MVPKNVSEVQLCEGCPAHCFVRLALAAGADPPPLRTAYCRLHPHRVAPTSRVMLLCAYAHAGTVPRPDTDTVASRGVSNCTASRMSYTNVSRDPPDIEVRISELRFHCHLRYYCHYLSCSLFLCAAESTGIKPARGGARQSFVDCSD